MYGESLRAAMAERVNLGLVARLAGERIVRRYASVIAQPQHLPAVVVSVLRPVLLLPLADRQVEQAGAVERNPSAVVRARLAPGVGDEDVLDVMQRLAVVAGARQCGRGQVVGAPLGVAQIQQLVLDKTRVQRDVEEPA